MLYAKVNGVNGEVELSEVEWEVGELCDYYELLEWSSLGYPISNGMVMTCDGIVCVEDDSIDLVLKFEKVDINANIQEEIII